MFEITHKKAQVLLQVAANQSLRPEEKSELDGHLAKCTECRKYAADLTALELTLRRATHARWDNQQPKINLNSIIHPSPTRLKWNNFLIQSRLMGKVTIAVTLLLGYILIANFFGFQLPLLNNETPAMAPIPIELSQVLTNSPTPSAQFTLEELTPNNCQSINYVFKETDTLENIALQHGMTKEEILEYNNLDSNVVFAGTELVIPLCKGTPSQTATITITPLGGTILPIQPE